jgi:aldehyde:ferredoxin oxidoreductase
LRFGNNPAVIEMLTAIAERSGFGNLLADGSMRAAALIGKGSGRYAIQTKGLEIAMHDPRAHKGMGLAYAVSPVGGDHMEAETTVFEHGKIVYPGIGLKVLHRFSVQGKAELVFKLQNLWAALSAMGFCLLACGSGCTGYPLKYNLMFYEAVTGVKMPIEELLRTGERIFNLKRLFNLKHGAIKSDDRLPKRILEEKLREGGSRGQTVDLKKMLVEYYRLRGWDENTVQGREH